MRAELSEELLDRAREAIAAGPVDGWLLYDLNGRNPIATDLLGLPDGLKRRYFVLIPPAGEPRALTHRIERQPWEGWPGPVRDYVSWEELQEELGGLLGGCDRVAMEVSPRDAVPAVDQVPAGVVELVASLGVEVESSAELLSSTYARWGERGRELHDHSSRALAEIARAAFERCARAVRAGEELTEHGLSGWIRERCAERGLGEQDTIVAFGPNSANPHYEPEAGRSRAARPGDAVLIDLWARVRGDPAAVFADQTWMGILDSEPGGRFLEAWEAVRDARDEVVRLIEDRWERGRFPTGAQADRAARQVLEERGFAAAVQHRTGHGIDRALHGYGPNLDSVETRDTRRLVEGIGFSVEPGVYLEGDFGIRSEINVHVAPGGPEVTTPDPQEEPWTWEADAG